MEKCVQGWEGDLAVGVEGISNTVMEEVGKCIMRKKELYVELMDRFGGKNLSK